MRITNQVSKAPLWLNTFFLAIPLIGIFMCASIVIFAVYFSAWVSEDCFITLRYVSNTLNGHGAVFNVGEYVQGFTHPLWFMMLLAGSWFIHNDILTAVSLGLFLTMILLLHFGFDLLKHSNTGATAFMIFAVSCSLFISSDSWVSFQTGGLENALAHYLIFLVIREAYYNEGNRPGYMILLLSLLCMTRPDFLLFSIPFGFLILPRFRTLHTIVKSLIALIPSISWVVFTLYYYGSALPNTGMAKLGIYPDWWHAVTQGITYTSNWCLHDPFASGGAIAFFIFTAIQRSNRATISVLSSIILHSIWVISIGGDFMIGRFFMPVLTSSIIIGSLTISTRSRMYAGKFPSVILWISVGAIGLIGMFHGIGNALEWNPRFNAGIINERTCYPGYSLRSYLREGRLINPYIDLTIADELRSYAESCGSVTVHYRNPGTVGYLAGAKVHVIDTLGLTDRFISTLPKMYLVQPIPRPGHADKYIPVSYLASRRDISILANWETAVRQRNCTLSASLDQLIQSTLYWGVNGFESVQLPIL